MPNTFHRRNHITAIYLVLHWSHIFSGGQLVSQGSILTCTPHPSSDAKVGLCSKSMTLVNSLQVIGYFTYVYVYLFGRSSSKMGHGTHRKTAAKKKAAKQKVLQ